MKLHDRFRQIYRQRYPMRDFQPFSFGEREMVLLEALQIELDALDRKLEKMKSESPKRQGDVA